MPMSRRLQASWKLPRMHRGSAVTVVLVAIMFLSALLWVREQHTQTKPPVSGQLVHAQR